jgi:hypothetical protein
MKFEVAKLFLVCEVLPFLLEIEKAFLRRRFDFLKLSLIVW